MSLSNLLQITLEMWGCIISLILAIITSSYIRQKDKVARCLWALLLINTLTLAGDALAYVYRGDVTDLGRIMTRAANFMVFFTEYVFAGFFTVYTDIFLDTIRPETAQKSKRSGLLMKLCLGMAAAAIVLLGINQFTGFSYYFDEINNYHRGPAFFVGMALMGAVLLINIVRLFVGAKWMDRGTKDTFLFVLFIPVLAYVVQAVHYGFSLINIAITMSILIIYFRHMFVAARNEFNDDIESAKHETAFAYQKYYEVLKELEAVKKESGDNA